MRPLAQVRTADGGTLHLKTSYALDSRISVLFTGGPIAPANSSKVLFCGCDTVVNVVDLDSGKVSRELPGDTEPITAIAVSPDDETVVTASRSRLLRVYDWATATCRRSFKAHDGPTMAMQYHHSGRLLATGSSDSTVKVWDADKGFCTHNFTGSGGVVSLVQFHPNPKTMELFSCSVDGTVRWWTLGNPHASLRPGLLAILEGHNSLVRGLAFSPSDPSTVVTGGRDGVVLVWRLSNDSAAAAKGKKPKQRSAKILETVPVYETVEGLTMLPPTVKFPGRSKKVIQDGGFYYITAGDKGQLRIWEHPSGRCVHTAPCPSALAGCFWNPVDSTLVACTFDHTVLIHKPKDLSVAKRFVGSFDEVTSLKFVGEGQTHLAVSTNTEHIQVLDVKTRDSAVLEGHTAIILSLATTSDGLLLVSGSKDNTARVWQPNDDGVWSCVAVARGHAGDVTAVTVGRKGETAYFVTGSSDCTVKMWKLPSEFDVGANGEYAELRSSYTRKAHDKDVNGVAVSPNHKLVATAGGDRLAKVWHAETGELVGTLRGHKRGVWAVKFSPIDQVIVTASADATIRLWAVADFTCVKMFEGHDASVLDVTFLCRGVQLLSASADGLMKLWTIKSNELVSTVEAHEGRIWALESAQDETALVTGGQDGSIAFWRDTTLEVDAVQQQEEEDRIVKTQDLMNLIAQDKLLPAARLAIEIGHPFKLLSILTMMMRKPEADQMLQDLVKGLDPSSIEKLLGYIQDWNTNSKRCHTAHAVLGAVLRAVPAEELIRLPTTSSVVHSLLAYSDRHFRRLTALQQAVRLIDYTWAEMRIGVASSGGQTVHSNQISAGEAVGATPTVMGEMDVGGNEVTAEMAKLPDSDRTKEASTAVDDAQGEQEMEVEESRDAEGASTIEPSPEPKVRPRSTRKSKAGLKAIDACEEKSTPRKKTRKAEKTEKVAETNNASQASDDPDAGTDKTPRKKGRKSKKAKTSLEEGTVSQEMDVDGPGESAESPPAEPSSTSSKKSGRSRSTSRIAGSRETKRKQAVSEVEGSVENDVATPSPKTPKKRRAEGSTATTTATPASEFRRATSAKEVRAAVKSHGGKILYSGSKVGRYGGLQVVLPKRGGVEEDRLIVSMQVLTEAVGADSVATLKEKKQLP